MKNNKKYFALIDAKDVKRLKKVDEPKSKNDETEIMDIFDRYGIPDEYRKLIIKLDIDSIAGRGGAQEYISRYQISFINTRKISDGTNIVGFGDKKVALLFRFLLEKINNEAAMAFYDKLMEEGYFDSYLEVIREIFGRGLSSGRKFMGRIRKAINGQGAVAVL